MKSSILLSLIFFCLKASAVEINQELVRNGDFSRGLDFWQIRSPAQVTDYGREKNFIAEDNGALHMNGTVVVEDGYIYETTANQCIAIGQGKEFTLRAVFAYEELSDARYIHRVNLIWYEKVDCSDGGQYGMYIEPKNILGWQNLEQPGFIPALNAKAVRVEIAQKRTRSMTSGRWDNVSLVATKLAGNQHEPIPEITLPVNENLLTNPSFDLNADKWHLDSRGKWTATDGDQRLGAVSITLLSDGGSMGVGMFDQCVNLSAHRYFTVGGSFKINDASTQMGGGRLRVTWYENGDCKGAHNTDVRHVDPKQTSGWQRLSVPLIAAPENSRSIEVEAIQTIQNQGIFTALWDDMYLKAIER